mgnify:CR=1 FL=1
MESTVKLYSLNYSETRTYLTALIFVAGNVVLPQLFHLFHQENNMASYLLLYSHRSLQIRMESRTAHSYSLSPRQLLAVRDACSCRSSCHFNEISPSCCWSRICGTPQ